MFFLAKFWPARSFFGWHVGKQPAQASGQMNILNYGELMTTMHSMSKLQDAKTIILELSSWESLRLGVDDIIAPPKRSLRRLDLLL